MDNSPRIIGEAASRYPGLYSIIPKSTRIFENIKTRVMNTKLTLTIDEKVIDSVKLYAHRKGKSLSRIVENYPMAITSKETTAEKIPPKVLKLMGVIKLPDNFNYKKEIGTLLSEKYKY